MNKEEIQEIITLIGCLDIDDIEPVNKYTANVLRKILNIYNDLQQKIDKTTNYYYKKLAEYEKENKLMPDESVMMFNLLEGNKHE